MKRIMIIFCFGIVCKFPVLSQYQFETTLAKFQQTLKDNNLSFKQAVFDVENTFNDGQLDYDKFLKDIDNLKGLCLFHEKFDNLVYLEKDSILVKKYASIFASITDTTTVFFAYRKYMNPPFRYDFNDFLGEKNWENMFVTKLLATRTGNCHSMPYLYKILCEELGVPCWLALAPNHIYIKHRSEKAGMYNTELTSASFPIDAWLMASGYITLEAIQNGIYMEALDDKKCIALCVLDLAKGYDRKYSQHDGSFVLRCCDLVLQYYPNCINALLLQADIKKRRIEYMIKQRGITPSVFKLQADGKILWDELNRLYGNIHKLGYRTMPEKMYLDWLVSLKAEREKYSNKQVTEMRKD